MAVSELGFREHERGHRDNSEDAIAEVKMVQNLCGNIDGKTWLRANVL